MRCLIAQQKELLPSALALITLQKSWTYSEWDQVLHSFCRQLLALKVCENQRVGFIADTSAATIALLFSLFRLGAIACPLSFRIPPDQIPHHLKRLHTSHFLNPSTFSLEQAEPIDYPPLSLDHSATFLFTSGSTAEPKIAALSLGNLLFNARGAVLPLHLFSHSRWLLSLPLFHVGGIGILFRCFLQGAAVVLPGAPSPITHLSVVPTQLYRLLQEPFSQTLRCLLLGGAPIPSSLITEAKARKLPLFTTYGMTEMSSLITLFDHYQDKPIPLPDREIDMTEDQEIYVRGKTLFQGYWDSDTATICSKDPEEWFPTKDRGEWMENGVLNVIGRKDRQFISGGENIQPEEIERVLQTLPGIRRATILAIPDPEFGKRPVAFIEDETHTYTLETLRCALKPLLPSFKHPVRLFPYPLNTEMKPTLESLTRHLEQFLTSLSKKEG